MPVEGMFNNMPLIQKMFLNLILNFLYFVRNMETRTGDMFVGPFYVWLHDCAQVWLLRKHIFVAKKFCDKVVKVKNQRCILQNFPLSNRDQGGPNFAFWNSCLPSGGNFSNSSHLLNFVHLLWGNERVRFHFPPVERWGNYPWGIIPWGIILWGIPWGSRGAPNNLGKQFNSIQCLFSIIH